MLCSCLHILYLSAHFVVVCTFCSCLHILLTGKPAPFLVPWNRLINRSFTFVHFWAVYCGCVQTLHLISFWRKIWSLLDYFGWCIASNEHCFWLYGCHSRRGSSLRSRVGDICVPVVHCGGGVVVYFIMLKNFIRFCMFSLSKHALIFICRKLQPHETIWI